MAFSRTSIGAFSLANNAYAGATVSFYTVDSVTGERTTTLATLYDGVTGTGTLSNPQALDSEGKFSAPVYIEVPVVGVISGSTATDHETGVISNGLAEVVTVIDDITALADIADDITTVADAVGNGSAGDAIPVSADGTPTSRTLGDRFDEVVMMDTSIENRVTLGTATAGGASTITLQAVAGGQFQTADDYYNGMTITITSGTGSGQSRTINDYVGSTLVATVSSAWSTQPDATSVYKIIDDRAAAPSPGQRWRTSVEQWYEEEGRGGGGKWVLAFDQSVANDLSDMVTMVEVSPRGLPGQNQNDAKFKFHAQVFQIQTTNDLGNPNGSDVLDVGPQVSLYRDVDAPGDGSILAFIMLQGNNDAGEATRYVDVFARVADDADGSERGELVIQPIGRLPWVVGGGPTAEQGGGIWIQDLNSRTAYTGGVGDCDNQGDGTINVVGLYQQGLQVATLAGTDTLTNKTLTAPVLSGTITGTYTLDGTPTIDNPTLSGTMSGGTVNADTLQQGSEDVLEAGTWTPAIAGSSTAGANSYSSQAGRYYRTGDSVYITGRVSMTSKDGAMAGNVLMTGLPFTALTGVAANYVMAIDLIDNVSPTAGTEMITASVTVNTTYIAFQEQNFGSAAANLAVAAIANNTSLNVSGSYIRA